MNYSESNDSSELLDFIKKKIEPKELTDAPQLLYFFGKSIKLALINTYKDQQDISISIYCANIISSIFRIIYNYSLNIKLSIFTCERAILLFNEYINISKSYNSEKINIMDIKQFIISKSIGPLILKSENNTLIHKYDGLLILTKEIITIFFSELLKNDTVKLEDISFYIETFIRVLSPSLIEAHDKDIINYIEKHLPEVLKTNIESLLDNINLFKIKLELILYTKGLNGKEYSYTYIDNIMNKSPDINKLLDEINEDENIKDSKYFKNIIKNI